jgi:hypothetical protein
VPTSCQAVWPTPVMRLRADRTIIFVAVLLAHGALLTLWQIAATPRHADARGVEPLAVLWLRPPAVDAARPVGRADTATPRAAPRSDRARPATVAPSVAPPSITVSAAPERPPGAASAVEPRPLDLTAPRALAAPAQRSMRNQALNDPRSNSVKPTVETRVAAVAGTPDMEEERMDATRLRIRQFGRCIEVHVSRNAQIDPWNQSVQPTPKLVKPCN